MKRINNVISNYLKTPTNYALLMTGAWGSGKTYYLKSEISKIIQDTELPNDSKEKYQAVVLSLYGVSSVKDLQTEILISLSPFLMKGAKFAYGITKAFVKGALAIKGLGDIASAFEDIESTAKKSVKINFSKFVLCLDDLERKSNNLQIEELIGFINNLVENENIKIILLANNEELEKDESYAELKEKTIGNIIEFNPDTKASINEIISARFLSFQKYKKFLDQNLDFISKNYIPHSKNLRIIDYALISFHNIFSEVELKFTSQKILKEKKEEILQKALKFTIAIAIEYKVGEITFSKTNEIDADKIVLSDISMDSLLRGGRTESTKERDISPREKFLDKHFKGEHYHYFASIFNYITGADSFDINLFQIEVKKIYHIENNHVLPQYQVFEELSYNRCYSLSNSEYNSKTRSMLNYSEQGLYNLIDYITIYHYCVRFNNPLRYNKKKLVDRLKKGIRKRPEQTKYDPYLSSRLMWTADDPEAEFYKLIKIESVKENEKIKEASKSMDFRQMEINCHENFELFFDKIVGPQSAYLNSPLFHSFNKMKFYSFLITSENKIKHLYVALLANRYPDGYPSQELTGELDFLIYLSKKMDSKCKKVKNQNVTGFLYHEILQQLNIAISNVKKR